MRKLVLAIFFVVATTSINAHDPVNTVPQEVSVGDILEIGSPDAHRYKHINFPRANFIIKRGGIANYKSVEGNRVVVTAVEETKDGTVKIKIKRTDGRRFFNSHTVVSADLVEALQSGELSTL